MDPRGSFTYPVSVFRIETSDGTAEAGSDYKELKETLVIDRDINSKEVTVEIIDDTIWEPDEVFFVRLCVDSDSSDCVIGNRNICTVTILNDDGEHELGYTWNNIRLLVEQFIKLSS